MRNLIIILIMVFGGLSFANAQMDTLNRGDILVGVNTQLSNVPISAISLGSSISYGITDNLFVGGSLTGVESDVVLGLGVRGYLSQGFFGQASYQLNTIQDTNQFMIGAGVTRFLNDWFYVEPSLNYNFSGNSFGLFIGCGLRI